VTRRLTTIVEYLHLFFIFCAFLSLPLVLLFPELKREVFYLIALLLATWAIFWFKCPLTLLGNKLRTHHDIESIYKETFIAHFLKEKFGMTISTPAVNILISAYMLAVLTICIQAVPFSSGV